MEIFLCNINKQELKPNSLEISRRLQTPKNYSSELTEKIYSGLMEAAQPKGCFVEVGVTISGNVADFGFAKVKSADLCKNLAGCRRAYLMAVTLGAQTDRYIKRLEVVSCAEAFVADALASAMAESAADFVNDVLKQKNSLRPRFSPGYGDLDLSAQTSFLEALNADRLIGIKLSEKLIMTPEKSITAVCGIVN